MEKKQTVEAPRKLKNRTVKIPSTKLTEKSDWPRTPIANEATTMLAENHCNSLAFMFENKVQRNV